MICYDCQVDAQYNRDMVNMGREFDQDRHNEDCGCPCQHRPAEQWEEQYSVKEVKGIEVHE